MFRTLFIACSLVIALLAISAVQLSKPLNYGMEAEIFKSQDNKEISATSIKNTDEQARPNIIVILADDLGYGDIGLHGSKAIKTPNIDQLAIEGANFSQAYSSAAICSPSRAGLLSGRYPLRSGIIHPIQAAGDSFARKASYKAAVAFSNLAAIDMIGGGNAVKGLPADEITIAELLKSAGYRTAVFGKWHLGDFTAWPEYHPHKHGFDHFVGFNMSNDDWPVAFYRNQEKLIDDIGLDQAHYTKLFTEEAIKFIQQEGQEPFFIFLSQKDPHQPFFPSENFAGKSLGGPYGDAVEEFDWSVGAVLEALKQQGVDNNTLILVTSDNGPWYEGSAGSLRGRKGQSYEGGFKVPLLARWPNQITAGTKIDAPVMNIDFLPSFAAAAGVSLPQDRIIDGKSFLPLFKEPNKSHEEFSQRPLYFFHDYDVEAIRQGDWKLIANNSHYVWPNPLDKNDSLIGGLAGSRDYKPANSSTSVATLGTWPLLYNLQTDPGEAYNLAKSRPEKKELLHSKLDQWKTEFYRNPRGWIQNSEDKN